MHKISTIFKDTDLKNIELLIASVKWNAEGLVTAIAQDGQTGDILMLAWMNELSLRETLTSGIGVYYSRSRQRLWRKGEESGHTQIVQDIFLDCDGDAILLKIDQVGGIACHTGRRSCFYRQATHDGWKIISPILKDDIYTKGHIY